MQDRMQEKISFSVKFKPFRLQFRRNNVCLMIENSDFFLERKLGIIT